uniref:Uncharacterized protein n=1 Tax=Lotharella globosa TaxID=91324 RepID=A0A7S3ZHC6_9EUKA
MTVQIPSSPGSNLTASWRQEDMTTHRARGMCLEPLCKAASVVSACFGDNTKLALRGVGIGGQSIFVVPVAAVEHERPFPLPFRPKAFEAYRAFATRGTRRITQPEAKRCRYECHLFFAIFMFLPWNWPDSTWFHCGFRDSEKSRVYGDIGSIPRLMSPAEG